MAKEGPASETVVMLWRRCALAMALVAAAGCSESPREARHAAQAKPLPRPAAAIECIPCALVAASRDLVPLPPADGEPAPLSGNQAKLLPPQELPFEAIADWLVPRELPPVHIDAAARDAASTSDGPSTVAPTPAGAGEDHSTASALPLSTKDAAAISSASPCPTADNLSPATVRLADILAAMRAEGVFDMAPTVKATAEPISKAAESTPPLVAEAPLDESHDADAEQMLAEASAAATGLPTDAIVTERAKAKIRRGFQLAQRGANFAARSEFLEVLRMIAEAQDQKHGARRRIVALANGLRALDEAADFATRGVETDSAANLSVIISAHRTPVAKAAGCEKLLPQQLADRYFRYAQLQLGAAVAGEPAGSMALHALGKLYSQIGRVEPDKCPMADRRAFTLQQAALLARDDNHLAAHELGVLLAETGHYRESEFLLQQVAYREPHQVVFRNLARVQRQLGREQAALASEQQARRLAEQDRGASGPVVWVPPNTLAQTPDRTPPTATASVAARPPAPEQRPAAAPNAPAPMQNITRLPGGWMR